METVGLDNFVAECERMADRYGPRFAPSAWLKERAQNNRSFYAH
jgi:3-hydroxyacyl-CoA dehydrogenase/enoyl-CoA hydratase/3-hydroxybutyryl-CoA epimerase